MNSLGADVLRLWVSATDYANEMSVSDEILKRMADSYRRMRNTLRFLLGNLHGFDPARDALPPAELLALDRWVLGAHARAAGGDRRGLPRATPSISSTRRCTTSAAWISAASTSMSSRTACTRRPPTARARRSAQTAMYHIAESMVRWLAPILSFTAEEVWRYLPVSARRVGVPCAPGTTLPGCRRTSIDWPALHRAAHRCDARAGEAARRAARSARRWMPGSRCTAPRASTARFAALGAELRFLLITSEARVHAISAAARRRRCRRRTPARAGVWVSVAPATIRSACAAGIAAPDVGADSRAPAAVPALRQ